MVIEIVDWSSFRDMALKDKDMPFDYIDKGSHYMIYATSPNIVYSMSLTKGSLDATDFEDNWKSLGNQPQALSAQVIEESLTKKTGGHFSVTDLECDVPAQAGWHDFDFSWPHPVSLLAAEWPAVAENESDEASVYVSPDTTIGALTSDATSGSDILSVQASVTDNISIGYWVTITDGVNTEDLGRCIDIDKTSGTIKTETPTQNPFLASSPTYIKMTIKMVPWKRLKGNGFQAEAGQSKIGGSYLPANTVLRLRYKNNDGLGKKFLVSMEYLY